MRRVTRSNCVIGALHGINLSTAVSNNYCFYYNDLFILSHLVDSSPTLVLSAAGRCHLMLQCRQQVSKRTHYHAHRPVFDPLRAGIRLCVYCGKTLSRVSVTIALLHLPSYMHVISVPCVTYYAHWLIPMIRKR